MARSDDPPSLHALRISIKRLRYGVEFFGTLAPRRSGALIVKRLAGLQEELGQLNDLANAGQILMVCAGQDTALREAVTLIGGWHGQRYAELLAAIPGNLEKVDGLKIPRFAGKS
jgi:CHAD domain-containing protein